MTYGVLEHGFSPPIPTGTKRDNGSGRDILTSAVQPALTGDFDIDRKACAEWLAGEASASQATRRQVRIDFLGTHAERIHAELTDGGVLPLQLDALAAGTSALVPGVVPAAADIAAERGLGQRAKSGREVELGILFWAMLRDATAGSRLMHAMLSPTERALSLLPAFQKNGRADLGQATVERRGRVGEVTLHNPRYLNAEDDMVVDALETAVDLVLLDDAIGVGTLRGGVVDHPRYAGRRIFNAGINLTHLHQGLISFTGFMLRRELGYLSKIYRGLRRPDIEKPWIGAVDTFAIGGGAQILLTLDYVIAERDAYFSLPALREGIIPGAANLRLPRHAGSRLARQMIFADRRVLATEPLAAMMCDEVVPPDGIDDAIARAACLLDNPAVVPNRRMTRLGEEPDAAFREYIAQYSLEQVQRLHSTDLAENLERGWINRPRKVER
jgi:(3,5-dihydroxyphenyl)acetyl-CoA 1,2-dioxygenase